MEIFFMVLLKLFFSSKKIGFIFFSGLADRAIETNITYLAILAFGAQKALPLINFKLKFVSSE